MQAKILKYSVKSQPSNKLESKNKSCNYRKMKKIGDIIKEARLALKLSQEEAAARAGTDQKIWSKIERGEVVNSRRLPFAKIENVLGLPAGALTKPVDNILNFPAPLLPRCPELNWELAVNWPGQKEIIINNLEVYSSVSKTLIGPDSYLLKVESDPITNGGYFKPGAYLLVDPSKEIKSGDFVIAKIKNINKAVCRKYACEGELKYIYSEMSIIEPMKLDENLKILGSVVLNFNMINK